MKPDVDRRSIPRLLAPGAVALLRAVQATAWVSLLGVAAAGCASQSAGEQDLARAPADQRFDSVRSTIASDVANGVLKSVAIGVIDRGEIVWAEAFGSADDEAGIPATVATPYGIASMGKALTAAAVMTLVEAGRLDLDAGVEDILGSGAVRVHAGTRPPTVRELLDMTSGIPHGAVTYFDAPSVAEADVLEAQSMVVFPAGSTLHYSNFSVAMAERVIERVSGQSYAAYLELALFRPLRMTNALIGPDHPGAAARYGEDGARLPRLTPYPKSSRQISASLSDLLKFAAMLSKSRIPGGKAPLSEASIDRMEIEVSAVDGAFIALGLGRIGAGGGYPWLMSNGNDMGVQSAMVLLPERNLAAVVLTNTSGHQVDLLALRTVDAAAPGFLDRAMADIAAIEGRATPFRPDARWSGAWNGSVASARGEIPVSLVVAESGEISIDYDGGPSQPLEEISLRDGVLTASFEGILPLFEAPGGPHRIDLSIRAEDGTLAGFALANFQSGRGKFEIPTPIVLHRSD